MARDKYKQNVSKVWIYVVVTIVVIIIALGVAFSSCFGRGYYGDGYYYGRSHSHHYYGGGHRFGK